jgi:hypothetical protein
MIFGGCLKPLKENFPLSSGEVKRSFGGKIGSLKEKLHFLSPHLK